MKYNEWDRFYHRIYRHSDKKHETFDNLLPGIVQSEASGYPVRLRSKGNNFTGLYSCFADIVTTIKKPPFNPDYATEYYILYSDHKLQNREE